MALVGCHPSTTVVGGFTIELDRDAGEVTISHEEFGSTLQGQGMCSGGPGVNREIGGLEVIVEGETEREYHLVVVASPLR
ncbi:MAG: hypothetical protein HN348_29070 [Proteobacteria bacterium]|nr:hypothetical protein [Pseudomonadota bacterium]